MDNLVRKVANGMLYLRLKECKEDFRTSTQTVNLTYDILNVGDKNRFFVRGKTGKVMCVHNCGYAMSPATFGTKMRQQGLDDIAYEADYLVGTYRQSYPHIPKFWKICDRVINVMLAGAKMQFGGPDGDLFLADGSAECFGKVVPSILLPNGTYLRYQNLRHEVSNGVVNVVYDQMKGRKLVPTQLFGGKLAENLIQALAFVVLKDQALAIYKRGVPIHINVHDEWGSIVPMDKAGIVAAVYHEEMSRTPDYLAPNLLACEVDVGLNYADTTPINVSKYTREAYHE